MSSTYPRPRRCKTPRMTDTASLRAAELQLEEAQLRSDVATLDRLLHAKVSFVAPDGSLTGKGWDLEVHNTGAIRVDALEPEDLIVKVIDGVGITILTARFEGVLDGDDFDMRFRFTRSWAHGDDGWRVVAHHASQLNPAVN